MKLKYNTMIKVLSFSALLIALISLPFLPDQIPGHYNAMGEIDRWGSKFEVLIFPMATIFMGGFLYLMNNYASKKTVAGTTQKGVYWISFFTLLLFNAMTLWMIISAAINASSQGATPNIDITQILYLMIGLSFLPLGNYMPKVPRNGVIGLRTSWSMKNDEVWRRCQVLGGKTFMICGGVLVVASVMLRGLWLSVLFAILMVVILFISFYGSYRIWKDYEKDHPFGF